MKTIHAIRSKRVVTPEGVEAGDGPHSQRRDHGDRRL